DITLKPEQIAELETPYKPHPVVGFKQVCRPDET
ncbi:hypothetical protein UZ965_18585, partial [Escherichia coli]|nr:hypothetical protein [Escherichia coli]